MKPAHPAKPDLLAFLRGELPPPQAAEVQARLAVDAPLRQEAEALERFLQASRAAFDPPEDAAAALRVATRIREQVAVEERRLARPRRSPAGAARALWVRLLAASVVAHALLLVVLSFTAGPAQRPTEDGASLRARLPGPRLEAEEGLPADVPWPKDAPGSGSLIGILPDPLVPAVEAPTGVAGEELGDLPDLRDRLREHPAPVALDMLVRTDDALKRRRLERLALDADGTLSRVRMGLRALATMQRPDGSFPAADGRTEVGQTALALLPFLGDGLGSRRDVRHPEVVGRAVAWLRGSLFVARGEARLAAGAAPVEDLGIALAALSEDYMVSYGRLAPQDAARRASELAVLASAISRAQRADGGFEGAEEDAAVAVWPMWGLQTAARTGTMVPSTETVERFRRWYAERPRTAEGIPQRADGAPDPVLAAAGLLFAERLGPAFADRAASQANWVVATGLPDGGPNLYAAAAGSGLLLHDPSTFRAWGRETAEALAGRLLPSGFARDGDPVGDTALLLLALQAAYRTY